MTRVTNFGRKRKYLEAGFATEPRSTPNEQPAPEVNTADGDHPKKKQKRTKKPRTDGGNEQKQGRGGEMGVEGKERAPSIGRKKSKITKKRGGAKSVHCILSFPVEG